jgi:hypothetical protein
VVKLATKAGKVWKVGRMGDKKWKTRRKEEHKEVKDRKMTENKNIRREEKPK